MDELYKKIHTREDEPKVGEKHVPVVETTKEEDYVKIHIVIGENLHPSEPAHFIQWIEILNGEVPLQRVYLSSESKPMATFYLKEEPENLIVREFCNIHGLWQYP